MPKESRPQTTMIIKLGAMGDFLLSLGPCEAIRRAYPQDTLILWTTPSFVEVARLSGLFDEIWSVPRFSGWALGSLLPWLRKVKNRPVDRIFDLQTSRHTTRYYYGLRLLGWHKEYSGIAKGSPWRHSHPDRNNMHTLDRQKDQLNYAKIEAVPFPNLRFLEQEGARSKEVGEDSKFFQALSQKRYVLLVPGGSAHRPLKRWPITYWKQLCGHLLKNSMCPVLIGGDDEVDLVSRFDEFGSKVVSLIGKTSLAELAWIGKGALGAVGNDTGAMHLLALMGCPTVSLFSTLESDPRLCAPRGPFTEVLEARSLFEISPNQVLERLDVLREKEQKARIDVQM